jgi:transposase
LSPKGDSRGYETVRFYGMRTGISIDASPADRRLLGAILADRNSPQKHVWRARIVLLTADGAGTAENMRTAGVSKTAVWRWQERFMEEGVPGLLRDKARPSRIPPLGTDVAGRVVALTLRNPPGETTHWTAEAMAKLACVSVSSVQRLLHSHGLQPHRVGQFKLSKDPQFAAKVRGFVWLYVDPPAHAIVLSVDEKSQILALDRTQPSLPLKKGRAGTMTHNYKRRGTRSPIVAPNVRSLVGDQGERSVEAVGKPVCGWELVGSRLMRFAKVEACRQARIASINGLTPKIAITRFML